MFVTDCTVVRLNTVYGKRLARSARDLRELHETCADCTRLARSVLEVHLQVVTFLQKKLEATTLKYKL